MKIIKMELTCGACPTVYDIKFENDSTAYLRYRWGYIALKINAGIPLNGNPEIIGEQIGDEFAGLISQEDAISWLEKQGYQIEL